MNNRFSQLLRIFAFFIMAIAVCTLAGWWLDISYLKSIVPELVAMNPLTAISFIFMGIGLLLINNPSFPAGTKIFATIQLLISIVQFNTYWLTTLRLDQILFRQVLVGNQMAPNTALGFILSATAMLFIDKKLGGRRNQWASQILAALSAFIALLVLAGYIYGTQSLIQTGGFFPMALNTSICFLLLNLGILSARSNEGFMATITAETSGGLMSRKLIPWILTIPVVLGWLLLKSQTGKWSDLEFSTALHSILMASTFLFVSWWCARNLNKMDKAYRGQTKILGSILERIADGVIVANREGKFTLFNPAAEKICGVTPTQEGTEIWPKYFGVYYPDAITPFPAQEIPLAKAIRGEETDDVEQFLRNPKRPGGVYVSVTGRPIFDENHEILAGVVTVRDITAQKLEERKALEITDELRAQNIELHSRSHSAAKMASLGEMAAGVGHEVNNPLTAIIGMVDELLERIHDEKMEPGIFAEVLESIKSTSLRIAKIIRSLKSFARDGSDDPLTEQPLSRIFEETAELCREKIRYKDIEFTLDHPPESLLISCRPTEIAQVLLNLIGNAQDAIKLLDQKWIRLSAQEDKDWVEISVTDSGCGISNVLQQKIFQPFFTTKEIGKGTGLGLSISREIIAKHGGTLELDSKSVNTRFVIRIPRQTVARLKAV